MDWNRWRGKKVFIRTKHERVFSGKVENVDSEDKNIIFIELTDKYGSKVIVVHSEILEIKEER